MKDLKNIAFKDMYCNTTKNDYFGRSNKIECLIWNPPVQLTGRALLFFFSLDDSPGRHLNLVNFEKVLQAKAKVGVISEKHFHYLQNGSLMHIIYQANSSLKPNKKLTCGSGQRMSGAQSSMRGSGLNSETGKTRLPTVANSRKTSAAFSQTC